MVVVKYGCALCLLFCQPVMAEFDTAEVLARVRQAVGHERLQEVPHGLALEGSVRHYGVEAKFTLIFDAQGRFAVQIDGPLGGQDIYDGQNAGSKDPSNVVYPVQFEARDLMQLAWWVPTGRWLAPDGPFEITLATGSSDDKQVALTLAFSGSPTTATLFIDRSNWLPTSMRCDSPSGEELHRFSDYREVAGVRLPFEISQTTGEIEDRYRITAARPAKAEESARAYAVASGRVSDTHFSPGLPPAVEFARMRSGHILVHPRIDGKDLGWFLFDSGAGGMIIDRKAADTAGMSALGELRVMGVGSSEPSRFRMGKRFTLGPMRIKGLKYMELDLSDLTRNFGVPIAGIVGFDVLARAVVEWGDADAAVRLYDPEKYTLSAGAWQPLYLARKHPVVSARFEGEREGFFMLDSGSDDTVIFHAPAVQRYELLKDRETQSVSASGFAGTVLRRRGTVGWFELGGRRFEQPRAFFETSQDGASDPYLTGDIGSGFLSAFRLVLDYRHGRIAFLPR